MAMHFRDDFREGRLSYVLLVDGQVFGRLERDYDAAKKKRTYVVSRGEEWLGVYDDEQEAAASLMALARNAGGLRS